MWCGINSNKLAIWPKATPDTFITHIKNTLSSFLEKKVRMSLKFLTQSLDHGSYWYIKENLFSSWHMNLKDFKPRFECYYFYSNTVSINVKPCFVVLVGILIIHSSYLKHEKAVFIYVNIIFQTSHWLIPPAY